MRLLETKGLTKRFGGLAALVDVDIHVDAGEIVALIGPNGAGKTTMFNLLTGFERPTRGKIIFKGRDITGLRPHKIAGYGLSRTWQQTTLFEEMTTLDSVVLACRLHQKAGFFGCLFKTPGCRQDDVAAVEQAEEILEFLGMGSYKNELTYNLPYGLQRILGVGMTMATKPELMLMDEPVTGMNPTEAVAMMDTIRKMRDRGITILVVEHNMKVVMGTSARISVLDFGRKIADGKPEEISNNKDVIEAYLGANVE
ncbi:MAG: ABC transporter ATP-binding protein [Deltaproteobacteria bacterium]|nr:ABC transporter ATP-binding protein [Deltaproteobacteria bacterium]